MSKEQIHVDIEVAFLSPDMTLHVRFFDYLGNKILTQDYVPERTCRNDTENTNKKQFFDCSECGYRAYVGDGSTKFVDSWLRCPHCGAKVVHE